MHLATWKKILRAFRIKALKKQRISRDEICVNTAISYHDTRTLQLTLVVLINPQMAFAIGKCIVEFADINFCVRLYDTAFWINSYLTFVLTVATVDRLSLLQHQHDVASAQRPIRKNVRTTTALLRFVYIY